MLRQRWDVFYSHGERWGLISLWGSCMPVCHRFVLDQDCLAPPHPTYGSKHNTEHLPHILGRQWHSRHLIGTVIKTFSETSQQAPGVIVKPVFWWLEKPKVWGSFHCHFLRSYCHSWLALLCSSVIVTGTFPAPGTPYGFQSLTWSSVLNALGPNSGQFQPLYEHASWEPPSWKKKSKVCGGDMHL